MNKPNLSSGGEIGEIFRVWNTDSAPVPTRAESTDGKGPSKWRPGKWHRGSMNFKKFIEQDSLIHHANNIWTREKAWEVAQQHGISEEDFEKGWLKLASKNDTVVAPEFLKWLGY